MGKRIRAQRRGKGSPPFRAHTFHRVSPARYPPMQNGGLKTALSGRVVGLVHDPGRGVPLALLRFDDGTSFYTVAPEGLMLGERVEMGPDATASIGNILPLASVPEGTMVCNVELSPGDGGKLARASGAYAVVVAHTQEGTLVKLPSGKSVYLDKDCRATVGVVAGAGRVEKPFIKAGNKYYWAKSKGRLWPITRGVAMVPAAHPHGGGGHQHPGKPTTVSRHAPPGRKVGLIAARKTGRGKR